MYNGEKIPENKASFENSSEFERINQERGEKTYAAAEEARQRELLEKRARLVEENQKLRERLAVLNGEPVSAQPIESDGQNETPGTSPEVPEAPETPETPENPEADSPTEEEIEETVEKTKKHKGARALLIGLAGVVLAGGIGLTAALLTKDKDDANTAPSTNTEQTQNNIDDTGETAEAIGIKDGYGEYGMWASENKGGYYKFACAWEVGEVNDNDEREMLKYTAENEVEALADYIANLPDSKQLKYFKGLSEREIEIELESLEPKEYEAVKYTFNKIIDEAYTREITLNGDCDNAYIAEKDKDGQLVHENMKLVKCTTHEEGTKATEFYWLDENGQEEGSMIIKVARATDKNGNFLRYEGCMQAVRKTGSSIYDGLDEVPAENPTPDRPTPETPENPTMAPKDVENLERIDEQIKEDIKEQTGAEDIDIEKADAKEQEITEKPTQYDGLEPVIIQNEDSKQAEDISDQISEKNSYSENRIENGGVQDDQAAQDEAGRNETPVTEIADILRDLGIN